MFSFFTAALERVEGEQVVEVVGRTQVERFAFLQGRRSRRSIVASASASGCGAPKRRASSNDGIVDVVGQFGYRAADLAAPVAVPAE